MIQIKREISLKGLRELKALYVEQATAPLDGMWLCGFVPMAKHFGIYEEENLLGYFCINDEGYLLQYILDISYKLKSEKLFKTVLETKNSEIEEIKGAFCSTAEPSFMSLCLDNFRVNKVNALMYQYDESLKIANEQIKLTLVEEEYLKDIVMFVHEAIGMSLDWLNGYISNLINRRELYAVISDGKIIATGECRGYDEYQTDYIDLGVIVAKKHRKKGIASKVLRTLCAIAKDKNLKPICSTETSNIGAQKAIVQAGFFANNRIVQFDHQAG